MSSPSTVPFATDRRIHVALAVGNLERSIEFYRILFGQEPTKVRPEYAKFEVGDPALNLALNESSGSTAPSNPVAHFGVQVRSSEAVDRMVSALSEAGLPTRIEEEVTCCYAVQNKVWVQDPDGNPWEVFVVLDAEGDQYASSASECCSEENATACCSSAEGACCQ